jgi:hypothetical protein
MPFFIFDLFDEASDAYDGAADRAAADFLHVIMRRDSHGVEAAVEGFEHSFGFDARADPAGGAMLYVDRRAYGDLVTFAIWLQCVKGRSFHQADHVRRRVHRRQFWMMRRERVFELDGLLGFTAGAYRNVSHGSPFKRNEPMIPVNHWPDLPG